MSTVLSSPSKQVWLRTVMICLSACVLSISAVSCDSVTDTVADLVMSPSDDKRLGEQIDAQIRNTPNEYPLLNSASANAYVQTMVNELIKAPEIKYRDLFAYKVEVIRDDKTINAFCTPGGYIYVYTGLMKMLDNEASLAGVIGHEIAHAERRHSAKRMINTYGVSLLLSVALGNNPSQLESLAGNLFGNLALLKNSRDDESESDEDSFKYLRSTNIWYAGGVKFFFEKIQEQSSSTAIERLLSTHPLPSDRVQAVNEMIQKANLPTPTEATLRSVPYQAFLKTLP